MKKIFEHIRIGMMRKVQIYHIYIIIIIIICDLLIISKIYGYSIIILLIKR